MARVGAVAVTLWAAMVGASPLEAQPGVSLRRYALVVGSSEGGAGREKLRYAGSDALAVSRVLEELGGVTPGDRLLLLESDRAALVGALGRMAALVAREPTRGERRELVLYYSGHSDPEGLLPRGERLSYAELRRLLSEVPVDVRIAILDSCGSGALTRFKGGVRRPAFLTDVSSQVRGHAFLASSSADEVAQESDTLGASFFTHFLVTGLRGAADVDADRRVTLNEAYQFAFRETLARTVRTQGGPQHAAYDIQLAGSGDLVMTDLRGASARLLLGEDVEGRVFVRDWGNQLAAELWKPGGRRLALGVDPGRYHVTLERPAQRFEAELTVPGGGEAELRAADLVPMTVVRTAARGGADAPTEAPALALDAPQVPLNLSLMPPLATNEWWGPRSLNHVSLGVLGARSLQLRGVGMAGGVSWVDGTVEGGQAAGLANVAGGELRGVQAALGGNLAFGDGHGVQAAVVLNIAEGAFTGLQVSATANRVDGVMRGLQGALGVNAAQELRGAQVGLFNLAGDVSGAQVGLVNVGGRVRGVQLGLLNISEDVTVPIGLLSIVRKGRLSFEVWADDVAPFSVGLKYGSEHVYVLVINGVQPWERSFRTFMQLGLGVHLTLAGSYYVDLDVAFGSWRPQYLSDGPSNDLFRLRGMVGWVLKRRFAVFAGASLNLYTPPAGTEDRRVSWMPQWQLGSGPGADRLWPGVMLGVRI
ncbi:caspase family protein [Myxococcaceae bacterium GXIMD 01537]